ncbi:hypothetical protein LQ327_10015 [Actinomycetospora endophytica]|uniref:Uncharacterized protein n=1 Tax=Actinomycetospora endophytica TaxID=2291215 RepID=A0ABS8P628_9PSEU|nr:hypothetical protein [Actinomycetospora endophytica]MCD2193711.1 hypothetical protein [Actinomycetospora endophytica]
MGSLSEQGAATGADPAPSESRRRSPLAVAVAAGIAVLGNLAVLHPDVTSGGLERSLRYEVDRLPRETRTAPVAGGESRPAHPAAAAVLTACSHLATRAYEDAYLALLTARNLL